VCLAGSRGSTDTGSVEAKDLACFVFVAFQSLIHRHRVGGAKMSLMLWTLFQTCRKGRDKVPTYTLVYIEKAVGAKKCVAKTLESLKVGISGFCRFFRASLFVFSVAAK